ncbi:MAG: hypothetical protein JSV31_04780 [Desulfobacterales bacterium]|nr:MAG: hypothetical protein JSV31_04780 [Desulfobacterales bacterium]
MKKFIIFIVVEAIIFLVAGIITFFLGNITIESYATILLYCGLAALASGVFMEFGSKYRPIQLQLREMKGLQSSQQQLREMKELQSSRKAAFYLYLIGIVLIAISYLLRYLS